MPRPPLPRTICGRPCASRYKPSGIPARFLREVVLGYDELEALRLADLEGMYHEKAAEGMGISRPTFGRLVSQARRKVADALFHGHSLVFEGGPFALAPGPWYRCGDCGQEWQAPAGGVSAAEPCSACGSEDVDAAPPTPGPTPGPGPGPQGRGGGGGRRGRSAGGHRGNGGGAGQGGGGRGGRGGRGQGGGGNRSSQVT